MSQKVKKQQPKKRLTQEQRTMRRNQVIFSVFAAMLIIIMVFSLIARY
jgi:hypothetical protein